MSEKKSSKITKLLAFDCETSGINFDTLSVADNYQMVSVGMIVASVPDFKPIDELYLEIQWDGKSLWSDRAEAVHGMSKSHLAAKGVAEDVAAEKIALFLDKHFGIDHPINLLGHNVVNFDLAFFKAFMWKQGLPFKFAHRHFDTFALSMGTIGAYDSDQLFEWMGYEKRNAHNSLEDARMSLKSYAMIKRMWDKYVE